MVSKVSTYGYIIPSLKLGSVPILLIQEKSIVKFGIMQSYRKNVNLKCMQDVKGTPLRLDNFLRVPNCK